MKKIISLLLILCLGLAPFSVQASPDAHMLSWEQESAATPEQTSRSAPEVSAPSVLLMDADTGTILYSKDANTERPLASVTKVMTLLLIFEAMEQGMLKPEDIVTVSAHAAGMGGSQVYLEEGEQQTVETLIKCIAIASANDACVAMAEFIAGSEDAFVEKMNEKAKSLGMKHTQFANCCGLDTEGHYSSALDIALMSRELTTRFPAIFSYAQIWMEDITHHTAKGDSLFTLSNTNKLLKQYEFATGLKTGFTSKALFCLSATASRDQLNLIGVIMAAPDSKSRTRDARTLFDWGFSHCHKYLYQHQEPLPDITVKKGEYTEVSPEPLPDFAYLDLTGIAQELTCRLEPLESVTAPVKKGDPLGTASYYYGDQKVGEVMLLAAEDVPKLRFSTSLKRLFRQLFFHQSNRSAVTVPQHFWSFAIPDRSAE